MSLSPQGQINLKRLGMFAVVAAAYLAWRSHEDPIATPATTQTPSRSEMRREPIAAPAPRSDIILVLDPKLDGDSRRQALHRLTVQGPAALPALRRVLLTPVTEDPILSPFEVSLRISALEAIDELAEKGEDVGDTFQKAAEMHTDQALQTLAMAALQGVQEGRPGKARRFINKMTDDRD